ncbi:MAG: 50S ribosomal protein L28 [Firmicutes bacterium]|nr:50S ribosomal protein L28 [Bacillota bacterium]
MATKLTSKKPLSGNKRSHALNATKKVQKPNLQKKTINGQKVVISAREAKTLNKEN